MGDLSQENKNMAGKILKWIFLGPVFLVFAIIAVALLYFFYCEANKAYWDRKVREWCELDGGIMVYEEIYLAKDELEKLTIPFEGFSDMDSTFYRVTLENVVMNENPRVWRGGQKIIRRLDNKILGIEVNYSRRGGDFPTGIVHESYFGCSQVNKSNMGITNSIFKIKE